MEGGRINHSWCMGVDSHRHGGFGGAGMEVVVSKTKMEGVGFMVGDAGALTECEVKILITPPSKCKALGSGESLGTTTCPKTGWG